MKIAIIGNMNNNGFALMRYLRDLGVDAHLLLYANDGEGSLNHFRPENDTWEIEKWREYIHQTTIPNSIYIGLMGWYALANLLVGLFKHILVESNAPRLWVPAWQMRKALSGYDAYVGSGIAPALFRRLNFKLDLFYPYGTGVEHLGVQELTSRLPNMSWIKGHITLRAMQNQADGIRAVRSVINCELSLTKRALDNLGVSYHTLNIPMVYFENIPAEVQFTSEISSALVKLRGKRFLFSAARQLWIRPPHMSVADWKRESKNSDWVFLAFSRFCKERPSSKLLLVVLEYGPDVCESKRLCQELKIDEFVVWIPKLGRKELLVVMDRSYAVLGEFKDVDEMIWGGTGWEALGSGRPLLQGFNFELGKFEQLYGYPPPPMLPVCSSEDILIHLLDMADHPEKCEEIGRGAKEWFNRYNGIGLAKQWLDLLMAPREGDTKKATATQGVHG